jgi:hypothetical protein
LSKLGKTKINRKKTEVTVCSKDHENINIKMDDDALKQVPKLKYLGSIFTEGGENKEDTIQRFKESKLMIKDWEEVKKVTVKFGLWSLLQHCSRTGLLYS